MRELIQESVKEALLRTHGEQAGWAVIAEHVYRALAAPDDASSLTGTAEGTTDADPR